MPLTLTRRPSEGIVIRVNGIAVTVHVADVDRNKVRLHVSAPPEVEINRVEVDLEKHRDDPVPEFAPRRKGRNY